MRWRRTLLFLHRDVGFFAFGLTVAYVVSGVAVNHRSHWDYNYSIERTLVNVGSPGKILGGSVAELEAKEGPLIAARKNRPILVKELHRLTGREKTYYNAFWRSPGRLSLFYGEGDHDVVDYLPEEGMMELEVKKPRFLIRAFNKLHLNESRRVWTWFADLYAIALLFLAISGAFIVKGKKGLKGRGGYYLGAGIVIPWLLYLFVL